MSLFTRSALVAALAVLGSIPAAPAFARASVDREVKAFAARHAGGTVKVIVHPAKGTGDSVCGALERGGRLRGRHALIGSCSAEVTLDELETLINSGAVDTISSDAPVAGHQANLTPLTTLNQVTASLGLGALPYTGKGVVIALIDSGIQNNPDFDRKIVGSYLCKATCKAAPAADDYGHGTHIAGIIGGRGNQSHGLYTGIAPNVKFLALKVLDRTGAGTTSDVLTAIQFATANKGTLGIDIINLSLGHPILEAAATDPLVQAVEAAVRAGIVVVVSAGNYGTNPETGRTGYTGISSPGNAPSAITVGAAKTQGTASRSDDRIADYSSRGPSWYDGYEKPDLVAPGQRVISNMSDGGLWSKNPGWRFTAPAGTSGRWMRLSGTSMSAGMVSGVAALVIEASRTANPVAGAVRPNALKAILEFTATQLHDDNGVAYDPLTQGAGEVNAAGALALAARFDTSAAPGTWWLTSGVTASNVIGSEVAPWAQNVLWGENILWGDSVYYNRAAWGQNIVWGENILWGENIIWGENIVWGENVLWGENLVWGENVLWGENLVWGENILWGDNDNDDNTEVVR